MLTSTLPIHTISPQLAWGDSTGKGVKVAVLDSGIDAAHPAVGAVDGYVAIRAVSQRLAFDTGAHGDESGHGTAVAGIIRAIAPECELYSIKVLGSELVGRGAVLVEGLRWAIEHGMQVCNLSIGTSKKDFYGPLHELADLAYFRNVMLVAAANNRPQPAFPAAYASVISVAAHAEDNPDLFYYNAQPPAEFSAHGTEVRVPWRKGGWTRVTGNSYAAPHITGIVTKILAKHPRLTLFQIKTILCALAANASLEAAY